MTHLGTPGRTDLGTTSFHVRENVKCVSYTVAPCFIFDHNHIFEEPSASSTATPMTTTKLIPSSSKYCGSPPPQSNFDCIGLAVVDEHPSASATSNESGCANFFGQAHHQNLRRATDIDEFETFEVSSQFSDVVCGAYEDDGVALADIEQLCSDLLTGVDESAAAVVEIVSHDTVVGELMSPASRNRKASEGEGCSITSSLQSSVIHHNYVTKSYAKWTASPCYFSAGKEAPYLPSVSIPGRRCPPQGYGVPALIAVPQANPQKTTVHSVMAAPELSTAVSMANPRDSSSQLFQINHSTKFCDVSLVNETQFSTGVATSSVVCPKPSEHTCSKCRHPGSDIKIKNCPNNCTYHARCLDLISACNQKQRHPQANVNSNNHVHNDSEMTDPSSLLRGVTPPNSLPLSMMDGDNSHGGVLSYCPSCFSSGTIGIEILPLDFDELDSVQRKVAEENYANKMRLVCCVNIVDWMGYLFTFSFVLICSDHSPPLFLSLHHLPKLPIFFSGCPLGCRLCHRTCLQVWHEATPRRNYFPLHCRF